jgi:hypothetical protein
MGQGRNVLLANALVLAEARSCLAALADAATTVDRSAAYERLLIDLDVLTEDAGPATYPIVGVREEALVARAEFALERLSGLGADGLSVELLIERLRGCAPGAPPVWLAALRPSHSRSDGSAPGAVPGTHRDRVSCGVVTVLHPVRLR